MMNKKTILTLCKRFQHEQPNPKTELIYDTPFQLLIAVMLSAQATDQSVNKVTAILFKSVREAGDLLNFTQDEMEQRIKSINYYKTKAKHSLETARQLIAYHHGIVPNNRDELMKLPGVGQKTANVVLNALYDQPVVAVDTHVFRLAQRLGLSQANTPKAVEMDLERSIPKQFLHHVNHWFVLHGRYVCKAKKPMCEMCFISDLCEYYNDIRAYPLDG